MKLLSKKKKNLLGIDANDSGGDRFTNTCGACDVNHLSCVHGGVQVSEVLEALEACMWHQLYLRTWHGLPAIR